ncbi:MAG: carbohydrate binding family 9 domain-containing protein [Gemmatimonadetes bacterium]|nr:carbohydrate binding family 9 domain-containing protein [Gemmatimonadota bacterium]
MAEGQTNRARFTIEAVRVEKGPILDGILDDAVWRFAPMVEQFVQQEPEEGDPATERTEVRVLYDARHLYIGVHAFDSDPSGIIATEMRRDSDRILEEDNFQIILDTFNDFRSGYMFVTSPLGAKLEQQISEEGEGGNRGGNSNINRNWDGVWDAVARRTEDGWTAEISIPTATLRFRNSEVQTWGINFQRNIQRRNETAFWSRLEQQFGLYRLVDAGTVTGIEAPRARNLKLIPSLKVTARRPADGPDTIDDESDVGIDFKYSLTPSLTLDATLNTDFAEVEVDEQQINLDRFTLFFPEKRPFFLENAGLFSVGASSEAELFFSRRIGISEDGTPIPIEVGARVTGKIGRTNIGVMGMMTDDLVTEEAQFAADGFGVLRVNRELPNRSNLGFLFVSREGRGSLADPDNDNQTFGIDGKLGIGEYQNLEGWVSRTETPGIEVDDYAYEVDWRLGGPLWSAALGYLEVGEGFNPEVGFLSRSNFRKPSGRIQRRIRPENLWGLLELRPHASYQAYWDFDGFKESELIHIDNAWVWRNGTSLSTGVNLTYEGVKEPFEISPDVFIQPGEYDHAEGFLFFGTDRGAPVSWFLRSSVGGFFGGDRVAIALTLRLRRSEILTSQITWDYNNVNLPFGDFDVNLGRLRLSYSPTPKLLVQLLTQYNDRTDDISTNLRFSWLRAANTGFFIVFNEIDEFGSNPLSSRADRSLIVKYSHLIDVFR